MKLFKNYQNIIIFIAVMLVLALLSLFSFRIDLTSERRYTISDASEKMLKNLKSDVNVEIYLDGELNAGFRRLRRSAADLLQEMAARSPRKIHISFVNPLAAVRQAEREQNYASLESQGIVATAVYERDKEGKSLRKIIFPYAKLMQGNKAVYVNLLKNIRGNSGEQNLNISIETLEYEFADALRRLTRSHAEKIAFLEGHGELTEAETYDISKSLSHYFQVDRGVLGNDASVLDDYKAVIVAKPAQPFSESDKFILDQYIMYGGRVLWLLDGARLDAQALSRTGQTPAVENDLNLADMLFKYGIRVAPVLLQDVQSVTVPVNIAPAGETPQFEPQAWHYAPLLAGSLFSPVSRNIAPVRGEYVSALEPAGNTETKKNVLLATSDNTHIEPLPAVIDFSRTVNAGDKSYFNRAYIPVAVVAEGNFNSDFENRMIPKNIQNARQKLDRSRATRQIFVADGDIIRNETNGTASDSTTLPLGYDRYADIEYGNRNFVQNAVLYLTDTDGLMSLKNRTLKLRLLNKNAAYESKLYYQALNLILPLLLLIIFGTAADYLRKRKYTY